MSEPYINQKINWRSRIVKTGKIRAGDITPHPQNPRRHPAEQRRAVEGSFNVLGQIAPIVVNVRNGYLVDGEERSWLALAQETGDDTELDCVWVDLTEDEHQLALTVFDWTSQLATYDRDTLDTLLKEVQTDDAGLQAMLSEMAASQGLYDSINPADEWTGMPEFEQDGVKPFREIRVVFNDVEGVEAFKRLVGQAISENTTMIYYPARQKRETGIYRDGES